MIFNYLKDISKEWTSWIFALSTLLGIYSQVTGKNILFLPWVYGVVALFCFIGANIQIYNQMKKKMRQYEGEEADLQLAVSHPEISLKVNPGRFGYEEDRAIGKNGIPFGIIVRVDCEIENLGREMGVFEWEISSTLLGSFLKITDIEPNGKFANYNNRSPNGYQLSDFSGEVKGRERINGGWSLELEPSDNHVDEFIKLLLDPGKLEIVIVYWTKKLGGKGRKKQVVIAADLSGLVSDIADRWEREGWVKYTQFVREGKLN